MRGRVRVAVGLAALAALVPASLAVAASKTPTGVAVPGVTASYSSVDPAGVLGGGPIHGMILSDFGKSPQPAIKDLRRIKSLGVNTVAAYVFVHQASPTSSDVYIGSDTVSDSVLVDLADHAHALGMAVELSPVIVVDSGHSPGSNFFWRGGIKPTDPARWWRSYNAVITHYTNVANAIHAEIFTIGNELVSMQGWVTNWEHLALWVNKHYHGLTTYMSTGNGIQGVKWLGYLDIIAASAYWSISTERVPNVDEMRYTWKHSYLPLLRNLYLKFHKRVLINEIGYCSVVYAAAHPAVQYQAGGGLNEQAQANAYEALLQAVQGQSWLRGVVWWHWDGIKSPINHGFSMRDKMAECVVAHYWAYADPNVGPPVDTSPDACLVNHRGGLVS